MEAPQYFKEEVYWINPRYFVAWNPRKGRWQIRMWTESPGKKDHLFFDIYVRKSIAISTVCFYDDNFERDIGYKPLDQRTIYALKLARWNADNPDAMLKDIDDTNERLEQEFDENIEYMMHDAVKAAWRHFHEPLLDLGS